MDGLDTEAVANGGVGVAPRFGASHALTAFGLMLFGQLTVGIGLFFVAIVAELAAGADPNDPQFANAAMQRMVVPSLIGAVIISIVVILAVLRFWAWHLVRDRSPQGLGLFAPPPRQLLLWTALGVAISLAYLASTTAIPTEFKGGPLAKMAAGGGTGRTVWVLAALLFAPFFEELLFRGLMLRGLIASWGVGAAGTIVTILFFSIHLFETSGYWPAMAAVFTMGLVTLFARLQTGSVLTSIAVHAAYNLTIVVAVYTLMPRA
jgi:membrane protease YdiL (CAAX protease family)